MERYAMLMNWKDQYCQDDSTTQGNLKIQSNPYQNTMAFSPKLEQTILKFMWKCKQLQAAKAILRRNSKAEGIIFPDFKLYYKITVIKTVCYWH